MPDLKNKYSDPRLDPSENAFDSIVNQPDMQSVNDQGDAIARDDEASKLRGSENNPIADDSDDENGDNNSQQTENEYNYPSSQQVSTESKQASRKKFWIAAGAGGGVIGALIGGLIALAPLKVPGMLKMVTEQTTQRLEQVTERRAKTILGRAILTKFGSHSGIVVTGDGAVSSLIASMRTANFEKKLAAKGLIIQESGKDGVRLFVDGKPLENGRTLRTATEVLEAMDGNPLTNKMIKQLVKEEIPSWRWMKKAKFAKWLRWKYNVPRYGILNSDNPDSEEKIAEMDDQRRQASNQRTVTNFKEVLACIMSGSCDKVEGTSEPSNKADQAQATVAEVEEAADLSTSDQSMTKTLLNKFGSKAIPVIGWIDLLATLDHFAYVSVGEEDIFGKISAYYKGAAYAAIYADWAGYGSQIELGAMDPEYVGTLADQLNDAEKAQLFQAVQGNPTAGIPIEVRVDEDKPSSIKKLFDNIVNSPAGFGSKYIGHPVLNVYYETIGGGGFLGWASGAIGDILGPLFAGIGNIIGNLTPDKVKELALESVSALGPYILKTFGLTIDAMDKGANLLNNIFAGGVVSANQYGKEIGFRKLTPKQNNQQNQSVTMDRAQYRAEKGLAYTLFSSEHSNSLTSQLAVSLPSSPESTISSLGSLVGSTPQKLLATFFPQTKAASDTTYEEIVGVNPYGATEGDLNQPLAEETITGDECPEVPEGEYDNCSVDKTVAEAMLCEFDPESPNCTDVVTPATTPSSGGSSFRVAAYNIKTGSSQAWNITSTNNMNTNGFQVVGLQEAEIWPTYNSISTKLKNLGYGIHPDLNNPDQATRNGAQARAIAFKLDKFKLVKTDEVTFNRMDDPVQPARAPIVWLEDIATGQQVIVINTHNPAYGYNGGPNSLYNGPKQRYDAALSYIAKIQQLQAEGLPIVFTGDFNEGWGVRDSLNITLDGNYKNLFYCMLDENGGLLVHAQDVFNKKSAVCNPTRSFGPVDHIYVSKGMEVKKYAHLTGSNTVLGTDHDIVPYADVVVPGTGSDSVIGANIRVATFNILHPDNNNWQDRLTKSVKALTDKQISIAGLQEARPEQQRLFRSAGYGGGIYDMYPSKATTGQPPDENPDSVVIWDKSKFELVNGRQKSIKYEGGARKVNIVKLRYIEGDASGPELYVLNTHDPVDDRSVSPGGPQNRKDNNEMYYQTIKEELNDAPVIFTGDFNSKMTVEASMNKPLGNLRENLAYCILTRNNLLTHVSDSQQGKSGCPSQQDILGRNDVDHIFISPSLKSSGYGVVNRGINGGDHEMVFSDITVPGIEGTVVGGGWVWPLSKGLKPGPCWGKSVGSLGRHAGMDINTDLPNNELVAMHDGTIVEASFDEYAGNYIKVKTTNGMYYIYQHLKSISKKSGTVTAGEVLGIAGKTGRVYASSAAHFHLVVSRANDFPSYGSLGGSIDPLSVLPKPAPEGYTCY